jgi:N-acetylneuraminate synthase
MTRYLQVGDRRIGPGEPTYVIAELSCNHLGRYDRAVAILEAAKAAGADAVKLQTYTPDTMTLDHDSEHFRIVDDTPWAGRTEYDVYREAYTPWEWHPKLQDVARRLEIDLFSTPYDPSAVAFLEQLGMPIYKVSSFELTDLPLFRAVAATGKPVLASTGLATLEEIGEAVAALRAVQADVPIALLRCVTAYPAPPQSMHLANIPDLAARFDVVTGLSDHSIGSAVAIAAVALGASVVEKHLTLARADGGADAAFSAEPAEFAEMVRGIRVVERAVGEVRYGPEEEEKKLVLYRRSLFVVEDVRRGEPFTSSNVRAIRPGHGIPPKHLTEVLGRRAARDISRGTPLAFDLIE